MHLLLFFPPNFYFLFFSGALLLIILPHFKVSYVRFLSSIQIWSHSPELHYLLSSICSPWIIWFVPMTNIESHDSQIYSINSILFSGPELPLISTLRAFRQFILTRPKIKLKISLSLSFYVFLYLQAHKSICIQPINRVRNLGSFCLLH